MLLYKCAITVMKQDTIYYTCANLQVTLTTSETII